MSKASEELNPDQVAGEEEAQVESDLDLTNFNGQAPKDDSVRERLRAKRDEIRSEDTLTLHVPGYDNELAVRYRAIGQKEMESFQQRIQRSRGQHQLIAACDLVIRCCDAIMVRQTPEAPLTELAEQGDVVKFDERLADFLAIEASSARQIVQETFGINKPLAPQDHAGSLLSWMQGRGAEIDVSLVGE